MSSPTSIGARNSSLAEPPIAPRHRRDDHVRQAQAVERALVGGAVRLVAERCRPASSMSKLYESFITNSRPRSSPARGRASSRNFVWIW